MWIHGPELQRTKHRVGRRDGDRTPTTPVSARTSKTKQPLTATNRERALKRQIKSNTTCAGKYIFVYEDNKKSRNSEQTAYSTLGTRQLRAYAAFAPYPTYAKKTNRCVTNDCKQYATLVTVFTLKKNKAEQKMRGEKRSQSAHRDDMPHTLPPALCTNQCNGDSRTTLPRAERNR